jgi:hypothetical protein
MSDKHAMTLRLEPEQARTIEAFARAERCSVTQFVRTALNEAIDRRRRDPEFAALLREIVEQDRELLERLAQ